MLSFLKKNKGVFFTFFLTALLTLLVFLEVGILSGTILISDLNAEYQPLLMQVRRILTGQLGLFDYNTGMGDNFIGTFYYYVSCPLNILTIFIKNINLLVIILVTLKLSLSATFAYLFFRYQFKEEKKWYLTIFSLMYALTSFSLSYYLHIMWLDIYMLFPLLLLGIDKIIKEKKHLLYYISLILIIFCNYYFAYMVCIFSFLYFNYKLLLLEEVNIKKILKENLHFIIVSFFTVLSASIVLLPVASEIGTYSRQNAQLFGGESLKFSFDIFNIVKHFILGNYSKIGILNDKSFYTFSSIIVIPLLYFYFINKDIKRKEKILTSIIFIIYILSMSCNYLNYAWHGFVPPSFFNGRYTFMFILFTLLICIKSIYNIKEYKIYHYLIVVLTLLGIIFLVKTTGLVPLEKPDIIKLLLFIAYILILILIPTTSYIKYALFILVCIEINLGSFDYLNRYNFNVESNNISQETSIKYIKEKEKDLFYRIDDNTTNSDNYSILYSYNSIDYFMSTVKIDLVNFFVNMDVGNHGYTKNTISYDGGFYHLSSLLNVKYYIETQNMENDNYDKIKDYDDGYDIYYNKYSLNLGYMVNDKILNTKLDKNGLENLNNIYKDMSGIGILDKVELEKIDEYNYKFKNKKDRDFYLLIDLKNWYSYSDLEVTLNDYLTLGNSNNTHNYIVNNEFDKDKDITIYLSANNGTIEDIEGVYVYYINNKKFEESINKLKEHQLEVTKVKPNKIIGEVEVDEDNILFTSIPYSKDLDIYVDGKKQDKIKLLDTFIGVKLDKGKHKIEIKYTPKMLYISFIPSIISSLLLYLYIKYTKKKLTNS